MRACLLGSMSIATLFAFVNAAAAQDAMLLPIGGTPELAAAHGEEARRVVERELSDAGITVLSPAVVQARATAAHVELCVEPSCAHEMLTRTEISLAVGVALWRRAGLVQAAVVLIDPEGHQVSASADGTEGTLGQAVTAALAQARARWGTRSGTVVRALGTPEGATITVDREPWGSLPNEGELAPGTHRFAVSAEGYETERRDVDVPAVDEPFEVRFELARATASVAPLASSGPDVPLLVVGSVVAVAGLAAVIVAIVGATTPETCVSACDSTSSASFQRPALGPILGWGIGGGVALVAGGVLIGVGAASGGAAPSQVRLSPGSVTIQF